MKQFIYSCVYALGTIGGLGWTLYNHAWATAAGILGLAIMAFPTLKKAFKDEM